MGTFLDQLASFLPVPPGVHAIHDQACSIFSFPLCAFLHHFYRDAAV
jgi:hypothetical protein